MVRAARNLVYLVPILRLHGGFVFAGRQSLLLERVEYARPRHLLQVRSFCLVHLFLHCQKLTARCVSPLFAKQRPCCSFITMFVIKVTTPDDPTPEVRTFRVSHSKVLFTR